MSDHKCWGFVPWDRLKLNPHGTWQCSTLMRHRASIWGQTLRGPVIKSCSIQSDYKFLILSFFGGLKLYWVCRTHMVIIVVVKLLAWHVYTFSNLVNLMKILEWAQHPHLFWNIALCWTNNLGKFVFWKLNCKICIGKLCDGR